MLGAVAAGATAGGYASLADAVARMAPAPATTYQPVPESRHQYDALYREYRRLYDHFGRGGNEVMTVLRRLRRATS
jgi:L-ribulokinase